MGAEPRLVMVAGSAAGSGKSTTMQYLAARLRDEERPVLTVTEDDVWGVRQLDTGPVDRLSALPLFFDLLHRPGSAPATPDMVAAAFEQLAQLAIDLSAAWLQDWAWPDLFRMLGWDSDTRRRASATLRRIAAPLQPQVIYLQLDRTLALTRALDERGPVWFNRYAARPVDLPVTAEVVERVSMDRDRLEDEVMSDLSGWEVQLVPSDRPREEVAAEVWRAAQLSGVAEHPRSQEAGVDSS